MWLREFIPGPSEGESHSSQMVVAGSGAVGKRMLCSSRASSDERKLMAMRHAVCQCCGFSLVNKVTLEKLHAVSVAKRS